MTTEEGMVVNEIFLQKPQQSQIIFIIVHDCQISLCEFVQMLHLHHLRSSTVHIVQ